MATIREYSDLGALIGDFGDMINSDRYSFEGLKEVYHNDALGLIEEEVCCSEKIINDSIERIKEFLSSADSNDQRVDELINAANVFAVENGRSPVISYDDLKVIIKDIFNE